MLRRRDVLIGAGLAGLAACGPKLAPEAPVSPRPDARWAPYAGATVIDGAGGVNLVYEDDADAPEVQARIAAELAQVRASGLTAVINTVAPTGRFWLNDDAFERTKRDLATWTQRYEAHPESFRIVRTAADLDAARQAKQLGIIFTFQGTEPLGEDADRVPLFRELGVRVIQLTHNRHNLVGDGALEPGNAGLSNYGRQVVERLNAERIVVDLAHGAQRTIREGILASKRPMLISHTGCRALSDLTRCTGDAELRLLADRGGVAGMIFWPYLRTDTQPMAIDLIRHLEHAIDVAGEDHVGLGTDGGVAPIARTPEFEQQNRAWVAAVKQDHIFAAERPADLYTFLPDLNVANRFELVAALLSARGHADARIAKILGGNFARVLREVWG
jgi:membrane dipeptidase